MTSKTAVRAAAIVATINSAVLSGPVPDDLPDDATRVSTARQPVAKGPFEPTWPSLEKYQTPDWFRDAKFGIWAHWGPQCHPEAGDWYARHMYVEGNGQYADHLRRFGHPSKVGFKDIIHDWKAEKWDPDALVNLYAKAGAKYFMALANHHDNMDLWDSQYQPWNAAKLGPKKDLIAGWAKAARANGLKFGVSVHAAHAWSWYETAQGADKTGPEAGKPYDGKLTKADGRGTWWEGLDPQQLYAQSHTRASDDPNAVHRQWHWSNGSTRPDQAYCDQFFDRTMDLINRYDPDVVYFDDTVLPLYPVSDAGLQIAAHAYNRSAAKNDGRPQTVLTGKILSDRQKKALVWDVERGATDKIEPLPWQACTCIGQWHYDRGVLDRHEYKSADTVIRILADTVSKNGNLLLSVPVRSDGTIDEDERAIVERIGAWMQVNGEAIYGTRPWAVYGEGPTADEEKPLDAQGFNEGRGTPFSAADVRFTKKGDVVYALLLGTPDAAVSIRALGKGQNNLPADIGTVTLLGSDTPIDWAQRDDALVVQPPKAWPGAGAVVVFKIEPKR